MVGRIIVHESGTKMVAADPHLDTLPEPGEGIIVDVKPDHVNPRFQKMPFKACQACGDPVDRGTPHHYVFVRLEGERYPQFGRIVFCNQECWGSWAGQFQTAD